MKIGTEVVYEIQSSQAWFSLCFQGVLGKFILRKEAVALKWKTSSLACIVWIDVGSEEEKNFHRVARK